MSEQVIEISDGNFEKFVLQSKTPVLVDFWAAWCAPCRVLAPRVEAIAEKRAKSARFAKLNVDDSPTVAQRYGIRGIPTLILFQDGEEKERLIGVATEEEISRAIDKHVSAALN
ncbi:MAG: thioredoxin [Deltaproteobacteria bacterium]|nr:thioredoxin [Deltaproteobacteria bacterium]MBI2231771.1 thioredoxin [Deltaproteobacteria bacterium]MBI2365156.1 thioredoxin [Deltaproteobacteria bacterium]MBI2532696.1 thioredoxin [Deltaproteobacteria bacterium]